MKEKIARVVLFTLLVVGMAELSHSQGYFDDLRLRGLGVERASLTPEQLNKREEEMINSQHYVVLREPQASPGAIRIQTGDLPEIFSAAARKYGVSRTSLEAIAYLESWGVSDAKSPTGPVGIMQFTAKAAIDEGLLVIKKNQVVKVPNGKDKKGQPRFKTRRVAVVVRDDRLDPVKSVEAAARRLSRMAVYFGGREDMAIANHHCGPGRMRKLINAYVHELNKKEKGVNERNMASMIRQYDVSFARIFFDNTPGYHKDVFKKIQEFMDSDQCPTYYFRIKAAAELLDIHRQSRAEFLRLSKQWENKSDSQLRAPNRIWAWLGPEDVKFKTLSDIRSASLVKQLVTPPSHLDFGYELRTRGKQPIGEKDIGNQEYYIQGSQAAVGALLYLADETRLLEGKQFKPLDVTSLVRSLEYQSSLPASSNNARPALPILCTGLAFDVSYKDGGRKKQTLQFVLDDMLFTGMVGFYEENTGSKTFRVVPSPKYHDFFKKIYLRAMALSAKPIAPLKVDPKKPPKEPPKVRLKEPVIHHLMGDATEE